MALPQTFISVSRRPPDVEDYIDMLRRYRSWIVGPMFAGLVISTVVAFLWRDTYQSVAMMRITPQKVSERLVPTEFSTQMTQRLNEMEQSILSRTNLEGLITSPALNLYPRERLERPMADIVDDMRNHDIQIRMIQTPSATTDSKMLATAFSITFTYPDRYKARAVVTELVSKFTEENHTEQRTQARLTTGFLDDELRTAQDRLNQLEAQITKFKLENQGKLPEEFASNTTMLNSLQLNNSDLASQLQRAIDMKTNLETQLNGQMATVRYYQDNSEDLIPGNSIQMSVQNQNLISTNAQLMQARQNLAGVRQSLGERNPTVKGLLAQVETLEKQKAQLEKEQEAKDAGAKQPDAPKKVINKNAQNSIMQLQNSMEATKTQIAEQTENIKRIQGLQAVMAQQIAQYQQRIQTAPLNEQQWVALQRDHALAQSEYDETVKKKQSAETSQNLEEHQAGENLEILDQPSDPQQPIEPHRAEWTAIGTGLGLLLGVVLAGGKEMKNTSLKNLKDVRAYTNLPVLSSIPLLENALLVRRKRRLFWLAWTIAFMFGTVAVLASMYYYYFGQK
jgi:uncharacterized protein involved in exopolysaccharide biosynthesis